jgi:hypothetical protein
VAIHPSVSQLVGRDVSKVRSPVSDEINTKIYIGLVVKIHFFENDKHCFHYGGTGGTQDGKGFGSLI